MNPELINESKDIQKKRYNHFEEKRIQALEEAKKKREEIISQENNATQKEKNFLNNTSYSLNNNKNKLFRTQTKFYDTSTCRSLSKGNNRKNSMIQKELEKLNLIKKQQIGEIRNMIDYEYFLNEERKKNKQKEIEKELKEERIN